MEECGAPSVPMTGMTVRQELSAVKLALMDVSTEYMLVCRIWRTGFSLYVCISMTTFIQSFQCSIYRHTFSTAEPRNRAYCVRGPAMCGE